LVATSFNEKPKNFYTKSLSKILSFKKRRCPEKRGGMVTLSRCQWLRGLRRGSSACLLGLWVRIPSGAWVRVSCECCVLSDGSLRRTHHSSNGVLPSVCMCVCVCLSVISKPQQWGGLAHQRVLAPRQTSWLIVCRNVTDSRDHLCYEECGRNFLPNALSPASATQWKPLKTGLTWKLSHNDRLKSVIRRHKNPWNGSKIKVIQSFPESWSLVFWLWRRLCSLRISEASLSSMWRMLRSLT
jgi:hypothetical protein